MINKYSWLKLEHGHAAKCEVEIGRDYALERDALKRNRSV